MVASSDQRDAPMEPSADAGPHFGKEAATDARADDLNGCRYANLTGIATGGMGEIYRAYDRQLKRSVALKVLTTGDESKTLLHRFATESRVLAMLQHPGIPPVFEEGRLPDDRPFIAMKLVRGQSLAQMLSKRDHPADDVIRFLGIFKQICETIAFAHTRGVLHRDLKPQNVMVGAFGEVQVIDWGIAKCVAEKRIHPNALAETLGASPKPQAAQTKADDTAPVTMVGGPLGTPGYMPPEQAWGRHDETCEASDVFSLGCILFEILTGQLPFPGWEVREIANADPVELTGRLADRLANSQADDALKQLAIQCLQPDPQARPQSATAIVKRLEDRMDAVQERIWEMELAETRERERHRRRRLVMALVVCASVSIAVLSGSWAFIADQKAGQKREAVEAVSRSLGEARQLQSTALDHPLKDEHEWLRASRSVERARRIAEQSGDRVLRRRVLELSSAIKSSSNAAARDRQLVKDLAEANSPVPSLAIQKHLAAKARQHPGRRPDSPDREPRAKRGYHSLESHRPRRHMHLRHMAHFVVMRRRYVQAFGNYGIDPETTTATRAADRLNGRPDVVREAVIVALDRWLGQMVGGPVKDEASVKWVRSLLKGIDSNTERNRIRGLIVAGDQVALRDIASHQKLLDHPPGFVWLVARQLPTRNESIELIRRARFRYPSSPIINLQLADDYEFLEKDDDAIQAFLAALATSDNATTFTRLAQLLLKNRQFDEAASMCRNAIRLKPATSEGYPLLARTLLHAGRPVRVIKVAEKGLPIVSRDSPQGHKLQIIHGAALELLGNFDGALKVYRSLLSSKTLVPHMRQLVTREIERVEAGLKALQ